MRNKILEYFRIIVIICSIIFLEMPNNNVINILMIVLNIVVFLTTIMILRISIIDETKYFPIRFFWGAVYISIMSIIIYTHRILYFNVW